MITKIIKSTIVKVALIEIASLKTIEKEFVMKGVKPDGIERAIRKKLVNTNYQFVKIIDVRVDVVRYKMSEETFIKYADVVEYEKEN